MLEATLVGWGRRHWQLLMTANFLCASIMAAGGAGEFVMRIFDLFLAAVSVGFALPAVAQPTDLQAKAGKDWKHKATGLRLPASLAGLPRDNVSAFGGAETDVGANYWSADGSENLTVFLYRNVSANAPVWFDRARSLILLQPLKFANAQSLGVRAFTPRGQTGTTGLMEIFATEGKIRSTGIILFPINGFYVKIRASSTTRDGAGLEQLLLSAINAIDWSSRQKESAVAAVQNCPSALPERSPAKLATVSSQDRMMSALIGGVVAQASTIKNLPSKSVFCREPGPLQIQYGIYRFEGSTERFIMALLDSGRAVAVGSSDLAQILSELKTTPRISVTHVELEETRTFGDFETLPLPAQALEMVEKTRPLSVAQTWGGKNRDFRISTEE